MEMTMNPEYKQTILVLWIASIIYQDEHGNQGERAVRIFAYDIADALTQAKQTCEAMAIENEWYKWMIYDIGIVPDDCFI